METLEYLKQLDADFAERITKECMTGDNECDHIAADQILLELLEQTGFGKTAEAYNAVGKWYA